MLLLRWLAQGRDGGAGRRGAWLLVNMSRCASAASRLSPQHRALLPDLPQRAQFDAVMQRLRRSLAESRAEQQPPLATALRAVAIESVGRLHRADLVVPMLKRARAESASDAPALFDAAVSGLARSGADDRVERARLVVADMRAAEVAPRRSTLRALFRAARGGPTDPLEILVDELQLGLRPGVNEFTALLCACRTARGSGAEPRRVPLLLQVMAACQLEGHGAAVQQLLGLVATADDLPPLRALLPPQLPQHTLAPHIRHALLLAQARVDRPAAVHAVQRALRTGDAPPADAALRAVLVGCCDGGEARAALALLRSLWRHGGRMSERTARRVLVAAGEAAGARRAGAVELLDSIRDAMFGESRNADSQRRRRRGAAAEHEATRALAIAEWSSGRLTAAQARDAALERLGQTGVAPRPVLASTLAYMLARDGAMGPAVAILRDYADETAAAPADDAAAPARTDAPFVALLRAVRRREHVEEATASLKLMAAAGIPPSLRARAAVCRLVAQVHAARGGGAALPSSAEFWRQLNELPPSLHPTAGELAAAATPGRYGGGAEEEAASAAAMAVDGRAGEILARIDAIVRADGAALAAMMPRPPGKTAAERAAEAEAEAELIADAVGTDLGAALGVRAKA